MRVNEKSVCCYVVDARTSSCTIEHDANAVRLYFIETKDALVADGRCLLFLINFLLISFASLNRLLAMLSLIAAILTIL